jgi:hypothetical protein
MARASASVGTSLKRFAPAWLVPGFALAVAACGDPAPDSAVAALGPEDAFTPVGPLHRPGQPCLLCHKDGGRAKPFTLAGTVYVNATSRSPPLANAEVFMLDAANAIYSATTNCAGNFFVLPGQFVPSYPVWLTLRAAGAQRDMDTPTYREGSCGACHTATIGPASPGPVYLLEDPTTQVPPANQCN